MTTIFLCEKPSQASDIAKVLGVRKRQDGYIETVDGSAVTWAFGHLLEQVAPGDYNEDWGKRWDFAHLPMVPADWKVKPTKSGSKQLNVIKKLLKSASLVVIATDAGREGELIGREILTSARYRGPVKRFWTSSLTPSDIKKALDGLRPGTSTEPLHQAALARAHADWLVGMNLSRASTLAAGVFKEVFPVGRVKTPTLALVVRRHLAIENFKADAYFELEARVKVASGELVMTHAPDAEHRIRNKADAERLAERARGATGPLSVVKSADKEAPPMPFSLPNLQKQANKSFGFSAKKTLELAQALYEKKAITYPRTDCTFLAESQVPEVEPTLDALADTFGAAVAHVRKAGTTIRKTLFDDSKLADHHAIVPTTLAVPVTGQEAQLFTLIAKQYLQALLPDAVYDKTSASLDANGVNFKASGRTVVTSGWKALPLTLN